MNPEAWTPIQRWLYAAACVLLPVAWGLAMVWVTNRLERLVWRRRRRRPAPPAKRPRPPTIEYHI